MRALDLPGGILKGIGVSKGVSAGRCLLLETREKGSGNREPLSRTTEASSPQDEADRFSSAVEDVKAELWRIKTKINSEAGTDAAEIFEAQLLMLEDPLFMSEVINRIHDNQLRAEEAVNQTAMQLSEKFSKLSPYMRERGEDVADLCSRLVDVLNGGHEQMGMLAERVKREGASVVLASTSLAAATIAQFDKNLIAGIVAEEGGATSHLAIIARSLKIPAVLGVKGIIEQLKDGYLILVDGDRGEVTINPNENEVRKRIKLVARPTEAENVPSFGPVMTVDGHRVQVFANVVNSEGAREALLNGAEGIGLFRTEFLYFDRGSPPTEDEVFDMIRESISIMQGKTMIVRTLDIGGDKRPSYVEFPNEKNPMLGLRGIRHSLKHPTLLETELAAILRASTYGDLWIMFPMVSITNDIKEARSLIEKAKRKLRENNVPFNPNIKIGIMVETPSAALMSDRFAAEADFFSIGTNDLVQYTLAADRENESVAEVADPLEPAVLKLILHTVESAHARQRLAAMCGEMASDLDAIPILIGMGLDEFSVDPSDIGAVKKAIRTLKYTETLEAVTYALKLESAKDVRDYLRKRFPR
jgi:phosphotransferase system enzyme I (PtsI)